MAAGVAGVLVVGLSISLGRAALTALPGENWVQEEAMFGVVGLLAAITASAPLLKSNAAAPVSAEPDRPSHRRVTPLAHPHRIALTYRATTMAALSQIRLDTDGRAYYRRKRAAGKTHLEALRCLKRRISDAVYRQLLDDTAAAVGASPGGQSGASQESSAADLPPAHRHFGSATPDPRSRRYAPTSQPRKPQLREGLRDAR